jgi:agmatinase
MFYKAIREGLIDPKRSVQVGIRTWNDDFMGMNVLGADWVHANGTKATVERILDIVGAHASYLTFDIDCLDPAFAPGTCTPVAGGLSSREALAILRALGSVDFVGGDVVEVSPPYDHADVTAIAGATVAMYYLGLLAERRRGD